MQLKNLLFLILCSLSVKTFATTSENVVQVILAENNELLLQSIEIIESRPSPLFEKIKLRKRKGKKVTAALLAFPFPCGMVGLHRIYLGSAPYIPVVYIATLGGALGILPFIDFCVLLIDREIEPYISNDKVFMWVN